MKDLWILVADADIEATMRGLLNERQAALGIRSITFTMMRHLQRDPGSRLQAGPTARPYVHDHRYALVLFDKAGSGANRAGRQRIQNAVEGDLRRNGWGNRSKAVVIEPELETWVGSASAHVGRVLGWNQGSGALRSWLRGRQLWPAGAAKPPDPKSALREAMREKNRRPTAARFKDLAQSVGLGACADPAFLDVRATLQGWFPAP